MLSIILIMIAGIIAGRLLRGCAVVKRFASAVSVTVCLLVAVLGFTVGANREVVDSLATVGVDAVILSLAGVAGSILVVTLIRRHHG